MRKQNIRKIGCLSLTLLGLSACSLIGGGSYDASELAYEQNNYSQYGYDYNAQNGYGTYSASNFGAYGDKLSQTSYMPSAYNPANYNAADHNAVKCVPAAKYSKTRYGRSVYSGALGTFFGSQAYTSPDCSAGYWAIPYYSYITVQETAAPTVSTSVAPAPVTVVPDPVIVSEPVVISEPKPVYETPIYDAYTPPAEIYDYSLPRK